MGHGASQSPKLLSARKHLSQAEPAYQSADGLFHLEEGLALLDELIESGDDENVAVARNVAAAYASRIYTSVGRLLDADRAVPEPVLEHLFRVVLAFDHGDFDLPEQARAVKIALARRLIDRYYEGHPAEAKQRALEQLASITKGRQ